MDTKAKKPTSQNPTSQSIKKTVSSIVARREYEQKREEAAFSHRVKSNIKEKEVTLKNFNLDKKTACYSFGS